MPRRQKIDVYKILKTKIQFLQLAPGTPINDSVLASELKVSRTPIREALLRLSNEYLIDIYPQSGTYVAKINVHLIKEIELLRHIVETKIALTLCEKKEDISEDVAESLLLMELAAKNNHIQEFIQSDEKFHRQLFAHAGHEIMWNIISTNRIHYTRFLMLDMTFPNVLADSIKDHQDIVKYIHDGHIEKLEELLVRHHDHQSFIREKEIREKYGNYFAD